MQFPKDIHSGPCNLRDFAVEGLRLGRRGVRMASRWHAPESVGWLEVDLSKIIEPLEAEGRGSALPDLGADTSTPTGKMMLNVLGGAAQFERVMVRERQREDIAMAMAEGADQGRKPTIRARSEEIRALAE